MSSAASTKDRLVTEAMRLFGEQGYQATKITQIEAAAGLAPGSGALYHHFRNKEALLEAGIDRQLDRRRAMHDIRSLFAGLGDLRIELTMLGRYVLGVLEEETQLLQIAARTPPAQCSRVATAYAALVAGLTAEVAGWIQGWAVDSDIGAAKAAATVAVDALIGRKAARDVFCSPTTEMSDELYMTEWTAGLASRVKALTDTD
jgi:AcrR family transcriptional regulator